MLLTDQSEMLKAKEEKDRSSRDHGDRRRLNQKNAALQLKLLKKPKRLQRPLITQAETTEDRSEAEIKT